MITAFEFNAFLGDIKRASVLDVLSLGSDGAWHHPWFTTVQWDPERASFAARIKPGFVSNGLACDVTASIPKDPSHPTDLTDIPLTDSPAIPLTTFRRIGGDAEPSSSGIGDNGNLNVTFEAIPEFFADKGVAMPPSITSDGVEGLVTNDNTAPTGRATRRLRAIDLVLHHDRPALSSVPTTGIGYDATQLHVAVSTITPPNARTAAYVRASNRYSEPAPADPLALLYAAYQQDTRDSRLIATVYLLSPEKAGETIDETWTPYVKHELFWNLVYAHSQQGIQPNPNPLVLNTGLAAGLLDTIGNRILSQVNDATAAALAFLSNQSIEGRFWSV